MEDKKMKIFSTLLVVLTLTALLLTGCGCSNVPAEPIMPTTRPTTLPTTRPTTQPTTQPMTRPTERPTLAPTGPTLEDGNGPAPTTATKAPAKR